MKKSEALRKPQFPAAAVPEVGIPANSWETWSQVSRDSDTDGHRTEMGQTLSLALLGSRFLPLPGPRLHVIFSPMLRCPEKPLSSVHSCVHQLPHNWAQRRIRLQQCLPPRKVNSVLIAHLVLGTSFVCSPTSAAQAPGLGQTVFSCW